MNYNYTNIRVEKPTSKIAVLSLINTETLNSLTRGVIDDLADFITKIQKDEETTVLIMRADGTKAFSSGMNFKDVFPSELNTAAHAYSIQQKLCDVIAGINNTHQIVINLSFGHCIGGGFMLCLPADIRIIADNIKISVPSLKYGVGCADIGSSYFLWREIGPAVARDLLFTGRIMDAEEALRVGYGSQCVPFEKLDEVGMAKAKQIAEFEPAALKFSKQALNHGMNAQSLEEALSHENAANEMIRAFSPGRILG